MPKPFLSARAPRVTWAARAGSEMPITPFHLGAGALIKCAAPAYISWTVFALANILIDLEPIVDRDETNRVLQWLLVGR